MESKIIGQVYAIDKVDQFGKISHEFVPLKDIPFQDGKTVGEAFNEQAKKNAELEARTQKLEQILARVVESVMGGKTNV